MELIKGFHTWCLINTVRRYLVILRHCEYCSGLLVSACCIPLGGQAYSGVTRVGVTWYCKTWCHPTPPNYKNYNFLKLQICSVLNGHRTICTDHSLCPIQKKKGPVNSPTLHPPVRPQQPAGEGSWWRCVSIEGPRHTGNQTWAAQGGGLVWRGELTITKQCSVSLPPAA